MRSRRGRCVVPAAVVLALVMLLPGSSLAGRVRTMLEDTSASTFSRQTSPEELPAQGGDPSGYPQSQSVSETSFRWINMTPNAASSPPARAEEGVAYDPILNETVMFGGYSDALKFLNDTWILRGATWARVNTTVAPGPRSYPLMTFDPAERGIVLFGGQVATPPYLNDTWLFNGSAWTEFQESVSPPFNAAGTQAFAWDPAYSGVLFLADTSPHQVWLFSNATWTQLSLVDELPSDYQAVSMTFDYRDDYLLLYGGYNSSSHGFFNSTWTLANNTWTELSTPVDMAPRDYNALVFDNATDSVIMVGGLNGADYEQTLLNGTWSYAAGNWTPLDWPPGPLPLYTDEATYDQATGQLELFDGRIPGGPEWNLLWTFGRATMTLDATISSDQGSTPLKIALNSSVAGGNGPYAVNWSMSTPRSVVEVWEGSNISVVISPAGTYTLRVEARDEQGVNLSAYFVVTAVRQTYQLLFVEAGLPWGSNWFVVLQGSRLESEGATLSAWVADGAYAYSFGSEDQEFFAPGGDLEVNGSGAVVQAQFVLVGYPCTFVASGLPTDTNWSVTFDGRTTTGAGNLSFPPVPNGTYSFSIDSSPGSEAIPSSGVVVVDGSCPVEKVGFAVSPMGGQPPPRANSSSPEVLTAALPLILIMASGVTSMTYVITRFVSKRKP